jgi:hypothetical protein
LTDSAGDNIDKDLKGRDCGTDFIILSRCATTRLVSGTMLRTVEEDSPGFGLGIHDGQLLFVLKPESVFDRNVTDRVKPSHRGSGQNQPVFFVISYTFHLRPASEIVLVKLPG